ncbi:MAG: WhiB family transcriptional regulator [Pseudonocardiaceae bacterium]
MGVRPEDVLRRVRGVMGTAGNEWADVVVARVVLGALLFGGGPVPGWRREAACAASADVEFYPEKGDQAAVVVAKRVCSGCPVRAQCLAEVLTWEPCSGYRHGVAGGLTPRERARLVAARESQAPGGMAA